MAAYISFQPTDFFSPKIYAGSASAVTVTGLNFQPDMVWTKDRQNTGYHALIDSVNGVGKYTQPDNASVQSEVANNCITSFTSDGFVTGTAAPSNNSSSTGIGFISWNWKVNATSATNSVGSVDVDLAVNTTAGISIGTYTGDGNDGATFGHGLGVVPHVVLVKSTSNDTNWYMKHNSQTSDNNMILDTTQAEINAGGYNAGIIDDLASTTTWTMTKSGATPPTNNNGSGREYVVYTFASVKGYSKFGKYEGSGNVDGPFIYTGFRPAYVLIKRYDSTGSWFLFDNKRLGYNEANYRLYADSTHTEDTTVAIDFVSNGFKLRNTDNEMNASGGDYVYLSFAEFPLVSSNSKAGVAR